MRPWSIAHRGGAGLRPENTLAAFADARGCDGAELDIQLTADGEVVVHHDYRLKPELTRDAGGHWLTAPTPRIKDLTLAELRTFDIGRAKPGSAYALAHREVEWRDGERIPTLAEVIAVAKTAAHPFSLFVELKTSFADRSESSRPEDLAERSLAVVQEFLDRTLFVGFDWPGLIEVKKIAPDAQCWFTTLPFAWFAEGAPPPETHPPAEPALQVLRHWAREGVSPWAAGYDAVHYGGSILRAIKAAGGDGWFSHYSDIDAQSVAEARALGLKLGAWTVNDPGDMRRLTALGLDAICTDRPDVLAGV
jgi:glycerophosphoryl diester phosphodiesterase